MYGMESVEDSLVASDPVICQACRFRPGICGKQPEVRRHGIVNWEGVC